MENSLLKKKKIIINVVYVAMMLGLFYLFMRYAFGMLFPFVLSFSVAMLLQRPINYITKKTPLKKGLVSAVLVLLLVAVIIFLLALLGTKIVSSFKDFGDFLVVKFENLPNFFKILRDWIVDHIHFLPNSIEDILTNSIDELLAKVTKSLTNGNQEIASAVGQQASSNAGLFSSLDLSILSKPLSGVWSTAKRIPTVLLATVISIFACCFMAADYDRTVNFIKLQLPKEKKSILSSGKRIIMSSLGKLIKAYIIIIFITFCEMTLGLSFLSLINVYSGGYILFIAAGVAIVDILPVLGTGTILIPWALYSFIMGDLGMGIGVAVLYGVITVIRQFVEPKLVANQLGLPPFVTIVGMYIGLKLFGVIGMFIVPLMIILVKLLNDEGIIHIWKVPAEEKEEKAEVPQEE